MKVLLVSPPVMDFVGGRLRAIAMDAGREYSRSACTCSPAYSSERVMT